MKLTVAECLSDIALSGRRLLNVEQKEKIYEARLQSQELGNSEIGVASSYSEDIEQLRDSVRMCLLRALSDSDEESPAVCVVKWFENRSRVSLFSTWMTSTLSLDTKCSLIS